MSNSICVSSFSPPFPPPVRTAFVWPPILRIAQAEGNQVTLVWNRHPRDFVIEPTPGSPVMTKPAEISSFELRYFPKEDERNMSQVTVPKDQYETTISGLRPETEYVFQVSVVCTLCQLSFPLRHCTSCRPPLPPPRRH